MDIVIHGDAEGYVGVCGPFVAGGHVEVHGSCYHQGPDGLWSSRAGLLS